MKQSLWLAKDTVHCALYTKQLLVGVRYLELFDCTCCYLSVASITYMYCTVFVEHDGEG